MTENRLPDINHFLIQTFFGSVTLDYAVTLIDAIRYQNWLANEECYTMTLTDSEMPPDCIPVGTVEFVSEYLRKYYGLTPRPINIPQALFTDRFLKRKCWLSRHDEIRGNVFVKSMDKIKHFTEEIEDKTDIPEGTYLVSEIVDILSEWRAFVFHGKLVGLQNYLGDFTMFPDVALIREMIGEYKQAPVAYTLDVGINDSGTFVIEIHDFFSCGLYGYANLSILPTMFKEWFLEYVRRHAHDA
jgi:hypothetical protein